MRRAGGGSGVPVNPERIRAARQAAGLTMAKLGGREVSRTFIHQLENGISRPSAAVLRLIARRTGKPESYFTSAGADEHVGKQMLASDLVRLASRVKRLSETAGLNTAGRQSLKLLESSLRHGAVLVRNL